MNDNIKVQQSKIRIIIIFSLISLIGVSIPLINYFYKYEVAECLRSSKFVNKKIDIDIPLIYENGNNVVLSNLLDKYNLIYFGYSFCPDVCPIDLGRNIEAIELLGERSVGVLPIFITVDPERDTAERLNEYTDLFDYRLLGLTGTEDQIKVAKKNFMVFSAKNNSNTNYLVDHSTFSYLVNQSGQLLKYFKRKDTPQYITDQIECLIKNENNA